MARPKRHKMKPDDESMNKLLQESYNQMENIRATIVRLRTKLENNAGQDTILLLQASKEIVNITKLEAEVITKKIQMTKLISDHSLEVKKIKSDNEIKKMKKNGAKQLDENAPMSLERRKELMKIAIETKLETKKMDSELNKKRFEKEDDVDLDDDDDVVADSDDD